MGSRSHTTEHLQQAFPDEYRSFFARCQKVASAPNAFFWTGELSGFYGGLTVSQTLPFRTCVGFEITFDHRVHVEREYRTYQPEKDCFETGTIDTRLCESLTTHIQEQVSQRPDFTGLCLHILTEIPLGHSLGAAGGIAAALSLLLVEGENQAEQFAVARKILSLNQAGRSTGASAYVALTGPETPLVFSTKDDGYFAKTVQELAEVDEAPSWPVDFGLIYTGVQSHAEGVIRANDQAMADLEQSTHELATLLHNDSPLDFRARYLDALNIMASLTVSALVHLVTRGSQNAVLESLFNSLNQYQNLLHTLHTFNGPVDLLYSRIHALANKQVNGIGSGVKVTGLGRGGNVLFTVPYGTHREALEQLVETLRTETGQDFWLDYASWRDGIGGTAARVEQDLTQNLTSPFVGRDSVRLTVCDQGRHQEMLLTPERYQETVARFDVLVDTEKGKVVIGNEPVSSKELPSQKATAHILQLLLAAPNLTVSSADLPASYGENRYDLQSKILIPLAKVIRERTGHELGLNLKGEMYENYTLSLHPETVSIGLLHSSR